MAAHPLGLLLAAVTALGYGIYKLRTYQTDAEKAAGKMNEAHAQAQGAFMEEERQIKKLFDALRNAKEGTEAYKKAKEDIWSKYGNYLKALGDENTALKDQAAAYALVTKKAREAAMAKAKEAFLSSDDAQKLSENLGKTYLEAYKLIEKNMALHTRGSTKTKSVALSRVIQTSIPNCLRLLTSKHTQSPEQITPGTRPGVRPDQQTSKPYPERTQASKGNRQT